MADSVVIDCPMPPSTNALWRRRNGQKSFYLAPRYATWKRAWDAIIMAMVPRPKVRGHFAATITLSDKKRRGDADNRAKAILDALQRCAIIENDSLADSITIRWGFAPEGCRVMLIPIPDRSTIHHQPEARA
jgi:Holliday junction resolvase RusA-like endonuclease